MRPIYDAEFIEPQPLDGHPFRAAPMDTPPAADRIAGVHPATWLIFAVVLLAAIGTVINYGGLI